MTQQHYYECPSYVCKNCGYTFEKDGFCPNCFRQLVKCDFKTEEYEEGMVCSKCGNGIKIQIKNKDVYKRFVEPIFGLESLEQQPTEVEEDIRITRLRGIPRL